MSKIIISIIAIIAISSVLSKGASFLGSTEKTSNPAFDLLEGFNTGFDFFAHFVHGKECSVSDPAIANDIMDIGAIFRNITIHSDFSQIAKDVLLKVNDITSRLQNISAGCAAYAEEYVTAIAGLKQHIMERNYYERIAVHTVVNIGEVFKAIIEMTSSEITQNHVETGRIMGELVKFVAFWNYTPATQ